MNNTNLYSAGHDLQRLAEYLWGVKRLRRRLGLHCHVKRRFVRSADISMREIFF